MKILVLLIAGILTACATTLTEEEAAVCKGSPNCLVAVLADKVQQEEYEAEDRLIRKNDEIVGYILSCHYTGYVMFYKKHLSASKPLIDRNGVVHVPRHSDVSDFACLSPFDARRVLEQLGGGDPRYGGRDGRY